MRPAKMLGESHDRLARCIDDRSDANQHAAQYVRPYLAFGSKLNCFGKVIAVSNDRPAQRDALQDDVENRNRKRSRWQTDELIVPRRLTMLSACENAGGEAAVTRTPCAPPPVARTTCSEASGARPSKAI